MDETPPIHVVSPDSGRRARLIEVLSHLSASSHETLDEFRSGHGESPCVIVADTGGGVPWDEVVALGRAVADRGLEWTVLLPEEPGSEAAPGGEFSFRPISFGFPVEAVSLEGSLSPGDDETPLFDLHEILRFAARIRHDINNPLTAGMAETQLLLMDLGEEGEVGESLTTIQRQLKRIQGLVQEMARLRPPRTA